MEIRCLVLESKTSVEENLRIVDHMFGVLKQAEIDAVTQVDGELYSTVLSHAVLIEEPRLPDGSAQPGVENTRQDKATVLQTEIPVREADPQT